MGAETAQGVVMDVIWQDLPDYADVFTVDEFTDMAMSHGLIDYDGTGYYANEKQMSDVKIQPSTIAEYKAHRIPVGATHVAWFNK